MSTLDEVMNNSNEDSAEDEARRDFDLMLNEDTSVPVLRRLFYKHFDPNDAMSCAAVLDHPKCPVDIIEFIAANGNGNVKYSILGGYKFPPIQVINKIIENDDSDECKSNIHEYLVDRSDITRKIANELLQSPFETLRLVAITNPYFRLGKLLEVAASDESKLVRQACAMNDECPSRVLDRLIRDSDPDVRAAVVANPNLKRSSLLTCYRDESILSVRMSYLEREDCPPKVIEYFLDGAEEPVRIAIAGHGNCPAKILRALANDPVDRVRLNVALNKKTPAVSVKTLAMDLAPMVRSAAGFHAKCPEDRYQHAFKIPGVTYPSDSRISELLTQTQGIKEIYRNCISENAELVENLIMGHQKINSISLAWDFDYFLAPPNYIDRTRGMLAGPFYTNHEYPWPRTNHDKLAEPIIQIDLDEVSCLRNSSYGSGLLQVFGDGIHLFTRNIPRTDISIERLTTCEWEFFVNDGPSFYEFAESPSGLILIRQIVGYKHPYASSDETEFIDMDREDIPNDFRKLEVLLKELGSSTEGNHLFGTFHEIQTRPCDGELLISLDESDGYVWGDSGNAQIFVKRGEDGFKYSAQWSCY